jgi:hypothetical protein
MEGRDEVRPSMSRLSLKTSHKFLFFIRPSKIPVIQRIESKYVNKLIFHGEEYTLECPE